MILKTTRRPSFHDGSASQAGRAALLTPEERMSRVDALRAHLDQGAAQAVNGEFVENYSIKSLIADLDRKQ